MRHHQDAIGIANGLPPLFDLDVAILAGDQVRIFEDLLRGFERNTMLGSILATLVFVPLERVATLLLSYIRSCIYKWAATESGQW